MKSEDIDWVLLASLLDDVYKQIGLTLNRLSIEEQEYLWNKGGFLDAWHEDLGTVQKILGVNL